MSKICFIPFLALASALAFPVCAKQPATLHDGWYLATADSLCGIDIPGAFARLSGPKSPPHAVYAVI